MSTKLSDKFTVKSYQIDKAPKKITLLGNRSKPESAQHIIEFPGGAIELSRTTDGNYWAHIIVNRVKVVDDTKGLYSAYGEIIDSRIDCEDGIMEVPGFPEITQIAILIRPA